MSRRRNKLNTKARHLRGNKPIEMLEERLLFNTIITDTNPLTSTPDTQSLEYKDARGNNVRITVHGDVSAEFIFAKVDKNGSVALRNAVGTTMVGMDGKPAANTEDGRDLFHIYIAQATIDSYISIAEVPAFDAKVRPMIPFTGGVTLRIQPNATTNTVVTTTTGDVLIGARTRTDVMPDTAQNIPIESISFQGLGLLAKPANGKLVAGITTAAGVSIGNILIGGTVTGEVTMLGSMQSFYCGQLLTGTTGGQSEGVADDPGNFFVQGDIRNILVLGSVGTTGVSHGNNERGSPNYWTGTDFNIGGKAGEIKVGGDYAATGIVHNNNAGLGLRTRQQEIEIRTDPGLNRGDFTEFENGQFGDNQALFTNDTFAQAQFLGSINSKQLGNNTIQLNGLYQTSTKYDDAADMYAVPLMAGQTITVRTIAPEIGTAGTGFEFNSQLQTGVFDPDQRLVATDYSDVSDLNTLGTGGGANLISSNTTAGNFEPTQQQLFSVTASKPGIYYIAVGENAPFSPNSDNLLGLEQPYQLQVTGVGSVGLGGLVVSGTIYAPSSDQTNFVIGGGGTIITAPKVKNITGFIANIDVEHGDIGSVISEGDAIIANSGGFNAIDDGGAVRDFEAASLGQMNGFTPGTKQTNQLDAPARVEAVTGSVGMIRSTGTDANTDVTYFNSLNSLLFIGNTGSTTLPAVGIIGDDVQYIESRTELITDVACNGSVGVIQANQFGVAGDAGSVSANVDGKGNAATIDLIDVTADLGSLSGGGPVISTNSGGNVRYIHLADSSTAYRPFLFGGSQPEQTTFAQGQEADFTDDSGTQVRLVPTFEDETDSLGNIILDANGNPISNSGTLTVLTYPIARSLNNTGGGGVVIIRAQSTRGMQVTSNGSSAEIGTIQCGTADAGPGLVFDDQTVNTTGSGTDTTSGDTGPDGVAGTGDDPFELDPNSTDTQSIDLRGSTTDVFSVEGSNFAFVRNRTDGEIVNTNIGTTGLLEAQNLGWARSVVSPGMDVEGSTDADNPGTSSFVEGATFPFDHAKNAIVINGGAEGNPAVVTINARQSIGNVMIVGRAQDITANADGKGDKGVFEGIKGVVYATGQLRDVNIGEGLLPSGNGEFAHAGLYANATNVGGLVGGFSDGLGRIELVQNQGLDSDVRGNIVAAGGVGAIDLSNGSIIDNDIDTMASSGTAPHAGTGADFLSSVEYGGQSTITQTAGVDSINVQGVGGMIGVLIRAANIGNITSLGGFGIINSDFTTLGAGRFQDITAGGLGIRGVIWRGGQSLQSINVQGNGHHLNASSFEPAVLLSGSTAIDPFLGIRPNGLTDLYVVTATTPAAPVRAGGTTSGTLNNSFIGVSRDVGSIAANSLQGDTFNIGNNIGSLTTGGYVDTSLLTAGSISSILIGGDVTKSSLSFSGPVANVHVGRSFKGSSNLSATGPNGSIGNVVVDNTLYGNISSTNSISSIRVGTFYGSQGTHAGKDIGKFVVGRDFVTGAVLDVKHDLGNLVIEGDFQDGATIKDGILGTKMIIGANDGDFVTE